MTTATPSTALVTIQPVFTDAERLALARVPGGVPRPDPRRLRTRPAPVHQSVPRPLPAPVCGPPRRHRRLRPRPGSPRAGPALTVTRRLCTIAGFYKYAVEEELLDHSPAARVRRPRVDYESHATALDRNELGAMLVAAGLGPAGRACADLPARAERAASVGGHRRRYRASGPESAGTRTLDDNPQGQQGRHHSARAAHRPGDRSGHRGTCADGPVFLAADATAAGPARRPADRPQSCAPRGDRQIRHAPHAAARVQSPAALDAGVPLRDVPGSGLSC